MSQRVKEILKLLHNKRDGKNLSSGEIADRVNLSTSGLYRAFKVEMKTSPRRYAKNERLDAARNLLETTLLSIKQITLKVGFTDQSHFFRDFKTRYGVTPTKYREMHFKGLTEPESASTGRTASEVEISPLSRRIGQ